MATVVQLKRSETTGVIPTASDIAVGELAVNLADGALYTKRTDGAIIEIGVSEQVPVFFADEVDLGDLTSAGETYDMGGLDGGSPGGGIELTALSVTDSGGDGSLSYNNTTGVFTYTGPSASDIRAHFSAGTGISITDGAIATSITQYADSDARASISVTDSGGDGSLSYDNSTGVITYTGPSAANVRAHFSASTGISITDGAISTSITQYTDALARASVSVTDSGGDGSLAYNSTTGVITYIGPSASDVRAHFSAGTGITITNGAVAVDSTIATKTYADNAATTAVANVIDTAPEALNTLNELAAALGDDASFSTTVSTSLGNRLRIDVNDQSLTSTQKTNALTNLGITASVDEINYIDGVTSSIQTQLNAKANTSSLATVATSGSYDDLTNKPAAGVTTGKAIAMAIVFGG
jgi:hypothetical protein